MHEIMRRVLVDLGRFLNLDGAPVAASDVPLILAEGASFLYFFVGHMDFFIWCIC